MQNQLVVAVLLGVTAVAAVVTRRRKTRLLFPVADTRITSPYGNRIHPVTGVAGFHNGVDFSGIVGTPIASPADGVVTAINATAAGGNQLFIRHDNGWISGYAHLSSYAVKVNQRVTQSQVVAYMGRTGQVTGPHLHFTLRDDKGNHVDPAKHLS